MKMMHKQHGTAAVTLVACMGVSAPALALDPASFGSGGMLFTPTLGLSVTSDDNVYADQSDESSTVLGIRPNFNISFEEGPMAYSLDYALNYRNVNSIDDGDLLDQSLAARASALIDQRNRLSFNAGWGQSEELAGLDEPNDEFRDTSIGARYDFGVREALLNAEFGAAYDQRSSRNDANLDKERDRTNLDGTLFVRISPRTQLLGGVRYVVTEYDSATRFDNTRTAFTAGARWQATGFISADARAGYETQAFDSVDRGDEDTAVWQVGLTWTPLTFSQIDLSTRRALDDGDDDALSIRTTVYSLGWSHDWTSQVRSRVSIDNTRESYDTGRSDRRVDLTVQGTYALQRWADVGVRYAYTDQSSSLADEEYDRNRYTLFVDLSF